MNWLIEPFSHPFMRTALLGALLISLSCATVGIYVVLRRMAFAGDALAHTALPGIVIAFLNGWSLFIGALVAGVVTALGIGWVSRRGGVREDTAIGVLFTAMFALGIVLMSRVESYRDLSHILFGNILGVSGSDLTVLAVVAAVVLGALTMFHKELELTSVDPTHAAVIGLSPDLIRYGLLLLVALAVVAGIQAVGVVLTAALLITPAATASLLASRLATMIGLSVLVAMIASLVGLLASYYFDVSAGASIVLTCAGCFAMVLIGRTLRRGLGPT